MEIWAVVLGEDLLEIWINTMIPIFIFVNNWLRCKTGFHESDSKQYWKLYAMPHPPQ